MNILHFISSAIKVSRLTITAVLLVAKLLLKIAIGSVAKMVSTAFEDITGVSSKPLAK